MRTKTCVSLMLIIVFAATLPLVPLFASHAPTIKRTKSDRDINAIGHRDIVHGKERPFITSPDKEREVGARYFAAFERSAKLIRDPEITTYLSALAQNIERNSDAHMPITVIAKVSAIAPGSSYSEVTPR